MKPELGRREFLEAALSLGAGLMLPHSSFAMNAPASSIGETFPFPGGARLQDRFPLRMAPEVAPDGIVLRAAPGTADVGSRGDFPGWLINGSLPSPLIRVRRGDVFSATLANELAEPLILHWHGMLTPEAMDGHPRLAIGTGRTYSYRFPVTDRAGCYWYHSHAHHRAGLHTYRGIAGLVIVEDPDEEAGLPSGDRELPIILQDRRLDANGLPVYGLMGPAMMIGMMGDEPFANGVHRPYAEVEAAVYRLRLLNGSTARMFRLARSDGNPLILVGGDAGLLSTPTPVPWLELAPGERADVILDARGPRVGDRITLRSIEFDLGGMGGMPGMGGRGGRGGMMGMMAAADRQGTPIDLLEFRVTRSTSDPGAVPDRLPLAPEGPDPAASRRERRFVFRAAMMSHTINGRSFEIDRIDERVPFGETEIWTFVNDSDLPHPVHLHATHFRVLERLGGRAEVMPWERGPKDTVLLHPGETVRVAVRFAAERGLFLLHCHNLEHEDQGMMQNILVE